MRKAIFMLTLLVLTTACNKEKINMKEYNGDPVSVIFDCPEIDGSLKIEMTVEYKDAQGGTSNVTLTTVSGSSFATNADVKKIVIDLTATGTAKVSHRVNINGVDEETSPLITVSNSSAQFIYTF
jgi:hypothetical protein